MPRLTLVQPKDMLSSTHRKTLQKQGYKIIGTHSGVKLCRWTKSMLRGRGGCYKHTFYGIASHLCMEMTPSMACANKCVFCWRHHKNPVGREWRWNMDPPKMIIDGALERHRQMIKVCHVATSMASCLIVVLLLYCTVSTAFLMLCFLTRSAVV